MSQKDLAKRLGLSNKTVSAYETGRAIPPAPVLEKISNATGTTINGIMGIKEEGIDRLETKINQLNRKIIQLEKLLIEKYE